MSLASSKNESVEQPLSIPDREPVTVGTPEGDNEYPPDAPLQPAPDGLQTPSGNAPSSYDADTAKPEAEKAKPTGIEKFIDEVARGEFM